MIWRCQPCDWQGTREETTTVETQGSNGKKDKDPSAEPRNGYTRSACPKCNGFLQVVQ